MVDKTKNKTASTTRLTKMQKVSEYLTKKEVKHSIVPSLNLVLIKVPEEQREYVGVASIKYGELDVYGLPVEVSENWFYEMYKTIIAYIVGNEITTEELTESNIKSLTV